MRDNYKTEALLCVLVFVYDSTPEHVCMCDSLSCSTYAGVCQHISKHAGLPLAVVVSFAVSMRESGGGGGGGGGALDRAVDPVLGTLEILSQHCTDCGLTPPQGALVL